jgi:transcriptional regulator with GAF, ATPase, and Fis domain
MDGADDLTTSLIKLTSLVSDHASLEETLFWIAYYCSVVVQRSAGSVMTLAGGHRAAVVASTQVARAAEAVHQSAGEGPSLTAIAERRAAVSASLGSDLRWPRFGAAVTRMGLHSVLAVPLVVSDRVIGSLSLYASEKGAFDERTARNAEQFARPAAVIAHNASVLRESRTQVAQLTEAMRSRSAVDQAIGILRSRTGISADSALARLRHVSNTENIKLVEVARRLVEVAAIRAARRQSP